MREAAVAVEWQAFFMARRSMAPHRTAAILLLLGACTPPPDASFADTCTVSGAYPACVRHQNPSLLALPALDPQLRLEIGRDVDVEPFIGQVFDTDRASDGHLYVSDASAHSIVVFDTAGARIRDIGRQGQGPGEFSGLVKIGIGVGDTVRAIDYGEWRLSTFKALGELISTNPFPPPAELGQIPELTLDADGRLFNLSYQGFAESLMEAIEGRSSVRARGQVALTRWSADNGDWIVLAQVPGIEVFFQNGLSDAPFARRPLWAPGGRGGVWYADSGEYTLTRFAASGDVSCVVEVEYAPPAVSAEDRRDYYEAQDVAGADEARLSRIRDARRSMPVPETRPALRRLVVAENGAIWVQPNESVMEPGGRVTWHVFSPDGSPMATASLPSGFRLDRATDDALLGVRAGSLGQHIITVYAMGGQ